MAHFSFYTFFRWSNLATQSSVNRTDVQNTALLIDFKIDLQYELQYECRVGVILIDFRYSSNVYLCLYWFQWKEYWSKGLLWFYDSTTNRANFFSTNAKKFAKVRSREEKRGWDLIGKIYGSPDLVARHFFSIQKWKKRILFSPRQVFPSGWIRTRNKYNLFTLCSKWKELTIFSCR